MDKPTHLVEFETMLLSRHSISSLPRGLQPLERSAYLVMRRLSMAGPMSIGELAEAFGLDNSTVHRQTAAMMKAGLIERIPDPEGGVARKFRLTTEGRHRLTEHRDYNIRALDSIMANWSGEDVRKFAEYLERFNTDLELRDKRPWPRPESDEPPPRATRSTRPQHHPAGATE